MLPLGEYDYSKNFLGGFVYTHCIDTTGKTVFALPEGCQAEEEGFSNGYVVAMSMKDGYEYLINNKGEFVVEPMFKAVSSSADGLLTVAMTRDASTGMRVYRDWGIMKNPLV